MAQMESWSWPPRYDNSYKPDASSRYWFPVRETMPQGDRDQLITRPARPIGDAVRDAAEAAGLTINDYLEALLARTHGLPELVPAAARLDQVELPLQQTA